MKTFIDAIFFAFSLIGMTAVILYLSGGVGIQEVNKNEPQALNLGYAGDFVMPPEIMKIQEPLVEVIEVQKIVYVEPKECREYMDAKKQAENEYKEQIALYHKMYPSREEEPVGTIGQRAWMELHEYNIRHGDPLVVAAIEERQQQDAIVQKAIDEGRMSDSGEIK